MEEEKFDDFWVDSEKFIVDGAGGLVISNSAGSRTGSAIGFSIGVEWGMHGYAGGVIDKKEAVRLAKHILRIVNLEELGI